MVPFKIYKSGSQSSATKPELHTNSVKPETYFKKEKVMEQKRTPTNYCLSEQEKQDFLGTLALAEEAAKRRNMVHPVSNNKETETFPNPDNNPVIAEAIRRANNRVFV